MTEFKKYIGLGFEHKGRGPMFDCLGLVLHIYKQEKDIILPDYLNIDYSCGWSFTGDSQKIITGLDQIHEAVQVEDVNKIAPYDCLTFFRKENSIIVNHIGMYIGNEKFIHILTNKTSEISRLQFWKNRLHKIFRYKEI